MVYYYLIHFNKSSVLSGRLPKLVGHGGVAGDSLANEGCQILNCEYSCSIFRRNSV
jgi:hypothetical protein